MKSSIIYIFDYHDGPLSGIIEINNEKLLFLTPFSDEIDDYESYIQVYPISKLRVDLSVFDQGNDNFLSQKKILNYAKIVSRILEKKIQPKIIVVEFERISSGNHADCFGIVQTSEE